MSTIAAISTPQAAGGLGIIRVSGENAIEIADRVFKPKNGRALSCLKGYRAALGMIEADGEVADEAVALVFRAPKSYTGEDVVEFSCHGGLFVLQKVLRALFSAGAVPAKAGEFTKRAFLNGKMDLTEAEAVMSLISAQGEQAAKAAVSALDGALSKKIKEINHDIVRVCAALSAWVDYPDEEIEEISKTEIKEVFTHAKEQLSELLSRFDAGQAITEGVSTAIVGRPNVGKSTLMNMLTGYNRSIVTSVAGTTRDIVEETVRLGDVVLRLADTAGIRDTDDVVESIGVDMAKQKIERASLVLAVFDVSRETNGEDRLIMDFCKGKNCIAVINKSDLEKKMNTDEIYKKFENVVEISADSGDGYDKLKETVERLLGTDKIDTSAALLTTERQREGAVRAAECLDEALEALDMGLTLDAVNVSADCAVQALLELTGEKASEVIVDEVFANFCVGK
ncbi:MAG: tRNA uridine-5-carboxymethylaminomethyl(34) synthesis GTPase MnmE [Acutalibacteraceae bacterium]